jgi:hypothetical protein
MTLSGAELKRILLIGSLIWAGCLLKIHPDLNDQECLDGILDEGSRDRHLEQGNPQANEV